MFLKHRQNKSVIHSKNQTVELVIKIEFQKRKNITAALTVGCDVSSVL